MEEAQTWAALLPRRIDTKRLTLRAPEPRDADAIFQAYAQDDEVVKFLSWRPHSSVEQTRAFVDDQIAWWQGTRAVFPYVLTQRNEDRAIGQLVVHPDGHRIMLGYMLSRSYWGKGLMPEALRAVIDFAFAQPIVHRVWAVCDVDHPTSARVLEKVGMRFEGILRRYWIHPNVSPLPRDVRCYALVRD